MAHLRCGVSFVWAIALAVFCNLVATPSAAAAASLPPGVLARAGGDTISVEDFRSYLEIAGLDPSKLSSKEKTDLLREYATNRALANEAREKGLDRSPETKEMLEKFDQETLPDIYFREMFLKKATVAEEDYLPYEAGLEDVADVRVCALATESEARDFLSRAGQGDAFESLAREYSAASSVSRGYLIRDVKRGDNRFSLEEKTAIFTAKPGVLIGPFANKLGGYSVIFVRSVQTVENQKTEIRAEKKDEILGKKAKTAYLGRLNEEMIRTEIEINEAYFDEAAPATTTSPGEPKRPYVAWIKGRYIYPQSLGQHDIVGSHGKKEQRSVLGRLLQTIVAVDLARKEGMDALPEYRKKRRIFLESQLPALLFEEEYRKSGYKPSEKEMMAHYRDWYKPQVFAVWTVANSDRAKVEEARRKAAEGQDLSAIADALSDDPARYRGGATGFLPISAYDKKTKSLISSMKTGDLSEVYRVGDKYVVFKLLERKEVEVPAFEQVRDKVRQTVILKKRAGMVEARRAQRKEDLGLKVDSGKLNQIR